MPDHRKMRLIYRIGLRLSLAMMPLLALWAGVFYFRMVDEINDETDDALEDYSELIIKRALAGEELPSRDSGSNNSYKLEEISEAQAAAQKHIDYFDANIFIEEKRETEPARVLVSIFRDKDSSWRRLTVSTPSFERDDLLKTVLGWLLFLFLAILVTGVSVTMLVFYRSLRPMYALLKWLDDYVPGRKSRPVPNNTQITELKRLNAAVEDATNRSEKAFALQKEFIGNASHELQTPLAVLGNRIERMINSPDLTESQMEELAGMLRTQRQVVRLNKELLLLTKIDNSQFEDSETVDIGRMVSEQRAVCSEVFEHKGICCKVGQHGELRVRMNRTLAEVLVSNLLRNAFIHSPQDSEISVVVSARSLTIANSGEEALNGEKIFERFHQGTKKEGSTGLGLAIVKAVCDLYKLRIGYSFEAGRHIFSVDFH